MVTLLVSDAQRAGVAMEVQLRHSHMAQEKQLEMVEAADNVSHALSELVVKARTGIEDLNVTVSEVKESLRDVYQHEWATTLWSWFQEAAIHFLRREFSTSALNPSLKPVPYSPSLNA